MKGAFFISPHSPQISPQKKFMTSFLEGEKDFSSPIDESRESGGKLRGKKSCSISVQDRPAINVFKLGDVKVAACSSSWLDYVLSFSLVRQRMVRCYI